MIILFIRIFHDVLLIAKQSEFFKFGLRATTWAEAISPQVPASALKTIMILLLKYLELARLHWSCFVSWIDVWGINTYPRYIPRPHLLRKNKQSPTSRIHDLRIQASYHGCATLATVNIGFFDAIYEETPRIQGGRLIRSQILARKPCRTFRGMFSNPVNPFKEHHVSLFSQESSRVFVERILESCSCKCDKIPCYFTTVNKTLGYCFSTKMFTRNEYHKNYQKEC